MKLTKAERETHIYYNEEENVWYAETSVQRHITKFTNQGWELVRQSDKIHLFKGSEVGINIAKPVKRKRTQKNDA